jgi:hypothetical protein
MLHAHQDSPRELNLPGRKVVTEILLAPNGVPLLSTDDGVVALIEDMQGFVTAEAMDDPGLLDALERRIRLAVQEVSGLDADLEPADWHMEFQMLMAINQFVPALRVISQARHTVGGMSHG